MESFFSINSCELWVVSLEVERDSALLMVSDGEDRSTIKVYWIWWFWESCSPPLCAGTATLSHRLQISGGNIDLQKWEEVGRCRSGECLELDAGSNWQLVEWDKERHNMWSLGFIENQMHCRILNHSQRFDCGWKSITVVRSCELWHGVVLHAWTGKGLI